jgi:hypothetical protein
MMTSCTLARQIIYTHQVTKDAKISHKHNKLAKSSNKAVQQPGWLQAVGCGGEGGAVPLEPVT